MNAIFLFLILASFLVAAWRQFAFAGTGPEPMVQLGQAAIEAAEKSVTLALGLIGAMALFLGAMKAAEAGGLLRIVAKLLRPLLVRLFPQVPADHPAMGAMVLNVSANMLGLGNAATPFGLKAMAELDKLNPAKGTASDAMVMFLAINTASVTLLPTSVIALRAAAGSADPAGVVSTTLFATLAATFVAILCAWGLGRFFPLPATDPRTASAAPAESEKGAAPAESGEGAAPAESGEGAAPEAYPAWVSVLTLLGFAALIPLTLIFGKAISPWILPATLALLIGFGAARGARVYDCFVEGAKDAFEIAIRIIPYLVAILVAVAMFRASGGLDLLVTPLGRLTQAFGLPPEGLLMGLMRSLSGSGAYGLLASYLNDPAIGPDSYLGYLASTIQASTETTFYVIAVYFGAVGIKRIRHALIAGLISDVAGIVAAVIVCRVLFL